MKDPAFLFYPNDYIGGTMGMTFEEKGAYMEVLMMQFNRGHMTDHMIGQTIGQLWVKIKDKFDKDEKGLYFNRRLEEEQIKRKNYAKSRRNNKSGANQYSKNKPIKEKYGGHVTDHMTGHMEDVNENENRVVSGNENEKKRKRFIFKKALLDYGFRENLVDDWLMVRRTKKAANTETAFNGFITELEKEACDPNEVLTTCIQNSWSGFKHKWLKNLEHGKSTHQSSAEKNREELKAFSKVAKEHLRGSGLEDM